MTTAKRKPRIPNKIPRSAFERAHLLVRARLRLAGRALKPQLVRHITEIVLGRLTAAQRRRLVTKFDMNAMRVVLVHAQPFAT